MPGSDGRLTKFRPVRWTLAFCVLVPLAGGAADAAEDASLAVRSLDGRVLERQPLDTEFAARQELLLAEAVERRQVDPDDRDAWIWVARRLGYLGRYREAIAELGEAHGLFPDDARFLRHRGHRLITVRDLEGAAADLSRAAAMMAGRPDQIEPDGLPNDRGIPTSTLKTNIWYHLGLTHYLRGEFEAAASAYAACSALAANQDMRVAADYWRYLSLGRAGRMAEAVAIAEAVEPGLDIIENDAYYRLLLTYGGEGGLEALLANAGDDRGTIQYPTLAYGVGAGWLLAGELDRARAVFESIVESPAWAAFGYVAAESELMRLGSSASAP